MSNTDFLTEYPAFKNFEPIDIADLSRICSEMDLKKDDIVFAEETPGDKMFIIKAGSVKVIKKENNIENTVAVLNKGDFFGEMAVLDGSPRSAGAKAVVDSKVLVITKKDLDRFKQEFQVTAIKLLDILVKGLSQRLRQANKNIEAISFWLE